MSSGTNGVNDIWGKDGGALIKVLLTLKGPAEAKRFLRDLLTEDEIRMIVTRWRVARMLDAGESYREIERTTGLSSRTVARISRWLKEGEGGYRRLLRRVQRQEKKS